MGLQVTRFVLGKRNQAAGGVFPEPSNQDLVLVGAYLLVLSQPRPKLNIAR